MLNTLDFLISSDVFEHVAPPASTPFRNAHRLLKRGGALILTLPYWLGREHDQEHFPELHTFVVENDPSGGRAVVNVTSDGREQRFHDPVFHGGGGLTLEMRVFSLKWILAELREAGFHDLEIRASSQLQHGIHWREPYSLPILAWA